MASLPDLGRYAWLTDKVAGGHPKMMIEALEEFGTVEGPGTADNPKILGWAVECGIEGYRHDSIAWCGLFMALAAKRAGYQMPSQPLLAVAWANFGIPSPVASFGDVLVFNRYDEQKHLIGGHVGQYVMEDGAFFHVLAGNQGNKVSITMIAKARLRTVRRAPYAVTPANVKPIKGTIGGVVSTNEA